MNKFLAGMIAIMGVGFPCFAQQPQVDKPKIRIEKMSPEEYSQLDVASADMQKAAEAYKKAADAYDNLKSHILNKYNATEIDTCHLHRIVDMRGEYLIVEDRPGTDSYISFYNGTESCGSTFFYTTPATGTYTLGPQ